MSKALALEAGGFEHMLSTMRYKSYSPYILIILVHGFYRWARYETKMLFQLPLERLFFPFPLY